MNRKTLGILERVLAFLAALILLQTLFYKFSGAEESKQIFTELGAEPYGRLGLGVLELIVGIMLIFKKTSKLGALGCMGLMVGAIGSHIFILGIDVNGDGGALFALAVTAFIASSASLVMQLRLK